MLNKGTIVVSSCFRTPSTFCDAFTRELTRKPDCERRFAMSFATAALNGGHTMTCTGGKVTDEFVLNDAWDWEDKWTVVVIGI